MFIGEYPHTIDQKGRINVPAKFKDILGGSFIMTKGLDGCIFVYHKDDWSKFEEKLALIPLTNKDGRKFVRFFSSSAAEVEPDKLGRVNIPIGLRTHAELKKDIITIGANNRAEIWAKEKWDDYCNGVNYIDEELMEKMSEFGI